MEILQSVLDGASHLSVAVTEHKVLFERAIGFHNDALHVMAGFLLHVVAALVFRKSLAHWKPWLAVLVLELANEANDLFHERWPDLSMQLGEGAKDLALTMAIPTAILILARWKPGIFAGGRHRR